MDCIALICSDNSFRVLRKYSSISTTVEFKKPCIESILAMDIINIANKDLLIESSLNEIDDMNISELYYEASHTLHGITLKIIDAKYEPEVYAMFIRITQRGSDKFENELIFAYDRLGHFFHHYFEEIDYAIDLYSKAIDLNPERPDPDTLEARGDCFSMKNDYKNALNDYKKALEMDGEYNSYLANIIEEFERMI